MLVTGCDHLQLNAQPSFRDIQYDDHENGTLDVFVPAGGGESYPTVLLVHGTDVDKTYFQGTGTIDDLLKEGYAAVSVEYRPPTATQPLLSLSDISCALGWVYANKGAYHFNTDTIVALGHSRGASLVALLAARNDIDAFVTDCPNKLPKKDWIRGVVAYAGSYGTPAASFSDPFFVKTFSTVLNLSQSETAQIFDELTRIPPSNWLSSDELPENVRQYVSLFPIAWIDGSEPPFLLAQGEKDEIVSPDEAKAFYEVLRSAGVSADLLIIPNGYHRLDQVALHDHLFDFLAKMQG